MRNNVEHISHGELVVDTKPLVLVVDDDAASRKLIRKTLMREGLEVAEAENGEQALVVFDRQRPDIVLLDVEMPVMDGFTACLQLRNRELADHIPILMITGLEDVVSVNRAYDAGATDFVTKPINWTILAHRVRYMLRASKITMNLATTAQELENNRIKLTTAQSIAQLGSWEIDAGTLAMTWSDEVFRILGADPSRTDPSMGALLGAVHPQDREQVRLWYSLALKTGGERTINHRVIGPSEKESNIYQHVWTVVGVDNEVTELHGVIQDITERQIFEDKIRELAYFDTLTGLPNRQSFMLHADQSIKEAKRREGKLAALFIDLDDFKRINDTFGHSTGDLLLQAFAERLRDCGRSSDIVGRTDDNANLDMISRFGGDEFTVLLQEVQGIEDAALVAQRIIDALNKPLMLAGHEVFISPSIGIAVYPDDGENTEDLFKNADTAMYAAKQDGKGRFQFYSDHMNARALERLEMENQLRKALERNELQLHYQPQYEAGSRAMIGVEALLRWNSQALGSIPPADFIPMAENSGLIIPIGEWILLTACTQLKAWQDTGLVIPKVAVNVSARQFNHPDFLGLVRKVIAQTGLHPSALELEITESLLMKSVENAITILHELKKLGVAIAIDDFGTGYSSLSYLKQFPIDRLKVDKSFINGITSNAEDAAITKALIAMANNLDLRIIAEGVETSEQLTYLTDRRCHEVQGYYLSKPLSVREISALLEDARAPIAKSTMLEH